MAEKKHKELFHAMSVKAVADYFNVDITQGLKEDEADKRLEKYGENELSHKKKISPVNLFLRQFCDFMIMVLLAAAGISALLGEYVDAVLILVIVVLNGTLGFAQEYKAEKSLEALKQMSAAISMVRRGGELMKIKGSLLVPGDIVYLEEGTSVPADIRLVEAFGLKVDESLLTGESSTVTKHPGVTRENAPLGDRFSMCYSGTVVTEGHGLGIVTATAMNTETGKIANLIDNAGDEATPLQLRLKKLGKILIIGCLIICALVSVAGILAGGDGYTMILTGVSLAVASIPEGLPAIVTICLAIGVWRLAKSKAIVRRLPVVETLGCTTCICADKTGTLTKNQMELAGWYIEGTWLEGENLPNNQGTELLLEVAANCHSLQKDSDGWNGDPTEIALVKAVGEFNSAFKREDEIPFSSKRRMMSVIGTFHGRRVILTKGAPQTILEQCSFLFDKGQRRPMTLRDREKLSQNAADLAVQGYRLLALSYGEGGREENLCFLGFSALDDPIREDVPKALKRAKRAGIRSVMITGDHPKTAFAVGKKLGLVANQDQVVTGDELRMLPKDIRKERILKSMVFARVEPEDKMTIVRTLKENGEIVAMTGDGVNDAPAIKEAHIGIAMGQRGTDVSKETADFILADDNFSTIVEAVYQGRSIYDNIKKFIRYLLASNIGEVLIMALSVAFILPMPVLPLQILWINLVTDGLPALAVAMNKPIPSLMKEPPRPLRNSVFADGLGVKIVGRGCIMGILCFGLYLGMIWIGSDLAEARTMAFTALVFSQLIYAFDCHSGKETIFSKDLFSNWYLWGATLLSGAMQFIVVSLPICQQLFDTVALSLEDWGIIMAIALVPSLITALKNLVVGIFLSKRRNFAVYRE